MTRKETLELFLALARAAQDPKIIGDTLWMPTGNQTVFEFLADKVAYPGDFSDLDSLIENLEGELAVQMEIDRSPAALRGGK